jgi:nicotinamide mononucleotide adenylyltransferase
MARQAAIYLGHLNPLTTAHENIISFLLRDCENVYIFPVRFLKDNTEINTKSFPFPYNVRKAMIEAVFSNNDRVIVLPDYAFFSPFIKYIPPLISPYSWVLRRKILKSVKEETFVSYSGDKIERIVLSIYGLHPIGEKRLSFSSSSVKEMLYAQAQESSKERLTQEILAWQDKVPKKVVDIIKDNWYIIQKFAKSPDLTIRTMGTKFPKNGFLV